VNSTIEDLFQGWPQQTNFISGFLNGSTLDISSPIAMANVYGVDSAITAITGKAAAAFGTSIVSNTLGQLVVGRLNVESPSACSSCWQNSDAAFIVGNGVGGVPSNAMAVMRNGDVWIAGSVYVNVGSTPTLGVGRREEEPKLSEQIDSLVEQTTDMVMAMRAELDHIRQQNDMLRQMIADLKSLTVVTSDR